MSFGDPRDALRLEAQTWAAGSVGSAAIQLGNALGATVIAVTGDAEELSFWVGIGADHLVDHSARAPAG